MRTINRDPHREGLALARRFIASTPSTTVSIAEVAASAFSLPRCAGKDADWKILQQFLCTPESRRRLPSPEASWPAAEAGQTLNAWMVAQGFGSRSAAALGRILGGTTLLHRLQTRSGRVYARSESLVRLWDGQPVDLLSSEGRQDIEVVASEPLLGVFAGEGAAPADVFLRCMSLAGAFSVAVRIENDLIHLAAALDWFDRLEGKGNASFRRLLVGAEPILGCLVHTFPLPPVTKAHFHALRVGTYFLDQERLDEITEP